MVVFHPCIAHRRFRSHRLPSLRQAHTSVVSFLNHESLHFVIALVSSSVGTVLCQRFSWRSLPSPLPTLSRGLLRTSRHAACFQIEKNIACRLTSIDRAT